MISNGIHIHKRMGCRFINYGTQTMNTLLRLFCCLMFLCLSSCATQQNNAIKSSSLSQCKQVCFQHLKTCSATCTDNCPACSAKSTYHSASNYSKYVHEQRIEGVFITRELNSYRDPLQCRKITCNCAADFNTCNQGCTGIIQKRLRAVPYCT